MHCVRETTQEKAMYLFVIVLQSFQGMNIIHFLIAFTPQPNAFIEKKKQSIKQMSSCMMRKIKSSSYILGIEFLMIPIHVFMLTYA